MSTPEAVLWNVDTTDEEVVQESLSWDPDTFRTGDPETAQEHDLRKLVEEHHYAPGGKFRSVLKVHARYERHGTNDKSWAAGTGWLIKDDLVVTAGHMVFTPERGGRAVYFNAYAGYHDLASVGKHNVQKRRGKRVAVSKAYYNGTTPAHDVALVKLKEPFEKVQPFAYCDTPEHGSSASLGVVGYPADKDRNGDRRDLGPFMYEEFAQTSWDLRNPLNLLQYSISTFQGQSGAPVICQVRSQCIGTHIHGFGVGKSQLNSASPIGGQPGVSYDALVRAIETEASPTPKGIWTVSISLSKKTSPQKGKARDPKPTSTPNIQPSHTPSGPSTQVHKSVPQLPKKENVYPTLKRYHTLFLVDDSDSMMDDEGIRWKTAKTAMAEIASIAVENQSDGVEVQFFNYYINQLQSARFKHLKSAKEVMRLFEDITPAGETPTATRLEEILTQYCSDFEKNRDIQGLNLIVLTDGHPSDGENVEAVIVKYAKKLKKLRAPPLKVGIQFVKIGNDPEAAEFLRQLDDNLKGPHKLDRDMVDTVLWTEGGREPLHEKILLGSIVKRFDDDATSSHR